MGQFVRWHSLDSMFHRERGPLDGVYLPNNQIYRQYEVKYAVLGIQP